MYLLDIARESPRDTKTKSVFTIHWVRTTQGDGRYMVQKSHRYYTIARDGERVCTESVSGADWPLLSTCTRICRCTAPEILTRRYMYRYLCEGTIRHYYCVHLGLLSTRALRQRIWGNNMACVGVLCWWVFVSCFGARSKGVVEV